MRKIHPKHCEYRRNSGFLFIPKTLVNKHERFETRWLEHTEWLEQYFNDLGWQPIHWLPYLETSDEQGVEG